MDDYFMQAHGGLFLLSGAIDDLPEEEFPEHFGMTKQDLSLIHICAGYQGVVRAGTNYDTPPRGNAFLTFP